MRTACGHRKGSWCLLDCAVAAPSIFIRVIYCFGAAMSSFNSRPCLKSRVLSPGSRNDVKRLFPSASPNARFVTVPEVRIVPMCLLGDYQFTWITEPLACRGTGDDCIKKLSETIPRVLDCSTSSPDPTMEGSVLESDA